MIPSLDDFIVYTRILLLFPRGDCCCTVHFCARATSRRLRPQAEKVLQNGKVLKFSISFLDTRGEADFCFLSIWQPFLGLLAPPWRERRVSPQISALRGSPKECLVIAMTTVPNVTAVWHWRLEPPEPPCATHQLINKLSYMLHECRLDVLFLFHIYPKHRRRRSSAPRYLNTIAQVPP